MRRIKWTSMAELSLLAGVLSVFLTVASGALQGYLGLLLLVVAGVVGAYLLWKWVPRFIRWVWPKGAAFRKISDKEFLSSKTIDRAKRISILAHTGKSIYREVHSDLEPVRGNAENLPEVRVLTRVPTAEGIGRHNLICGTVGLVINLSDKGVCADIRFYDALPSIRGIICEFENGKRTSFVSTYAWQKDWQTAETPNETLSLQKQKKPAAEKSHALDHAIIVEDTKGNPAPVVKMLESWFDHYWGSDEIHTVVFDFDDTLVFSTDIQVDALADAIWESVEKKLIPAQAWVEPSLYAGIDKEGLRNLLAEKFAFSKDINGILAAVLPHADSTTLAQLMERREERRYAYLDKAELLPGVDKAVQRLGNKYCLAIITLADETRIRKFMQDRGLKDHFAVVLGKKDPVPTRATRIHRRKVYLLPKLSQLLGIPLDRMVYVGDSDDDEQSALELGVDFIRARTADIQSGDSGRSSHGPILPPYVLSSYNDLDDILAAISKRKLDKKHGLVYGRSMRSS